MLKTVPALDFFIRCKDPSASSTVTSSRSPLLSSSVMVRADLFAPLSTQPRPVLSFIAARTILSSGLSSFFSPFSTSSSIFSISLSSFSLCSLSSFSLNSLTFLSSSSFAFFSASSFSLSSYWPRRSSSILRFRLSGVLSFFSFGFSSSSTTFIIFPLAVSLTRFRMNFRISAWTTFGSAVFSFFSFSFLAFFSSFSPFSFSPFALSASIALATALSICCFALDCAGPPFPPTAFPFPFSPFPPFSLLSTFSFGLSH